MTSGRPEEISPHGFRLATAAPLPTSRELRLNLDGRESIACRGKVVRCEPAEGEDAYHLGVAFEDLDDRTHELLVEAISRLMQAHAYRPEGR